MNKFHKEKYGRINKIWSFFSSIFLLILLLFFFINVKQIDENSTTQQADSLKQIILQDVAHCYAVEGTYPPSIQYLEDHYGLFYDKTHFYVDYISIGSNIMPDITVIIKE